MSKLTLVDILITYIILLNIDQKLQKLLFFSFQSEFDILVKAANGVFPVPVPVVDHPSTDLNKM